MHIYPQSSLGASVVAHTCTLIVWDVEMGGSRAQGKLRLLGKLGGQPKLNKADSKIIVK